MKPIVQARNKINNNQPKNNDEWQHMVTNENHVLRIRIQRKEKKKKVIESYD